ncbi:YicC family protein [Sporolactobacillus sp. CPB3-1]|uniref:YicC family protein n=1 Tax=Sporolactobacillus mangiferae TaxID=2940498 RepID=A0ABT0M7S3_9BACL|nr:YicC/YloC family endoribonuclease [Sporolactobacillus mangiferae]MCL1630914.1 YicC family protein [Sporolactobacillus mangiferae]
MIKSMTGFGMAEQSGEAMIRVELKSVNHRFFDFSFNAPKPFIFLEDKIRKAVHSYMKRGTVTVNLAIDRSSVILPKLETNWAVVDQYVHAAKDIQVRSGLPLPDLNAILQLPGIFSLREADYKAVKQMETSVLRAVHSAAKNLVVMREKEGQTLRTDLLAKIAAIRSEVCRLEAFIPEVRSQYERKLRRSIEEFLKTCQSIDETRLMNEVALFINKTAVDEELTRMKSHLNQCENLLMENGDDPVGRRLDFLIQEMNREVNTIGSKGNHAEISRSVVSLKTEIEKMREQVQNVE